MTRREQLAKKAEKTGKGKGKGRGRGRGKGKKKSPKSKNTEAQGKGKVPKKTPKELEIPGDHVPEAASSSTKKKERKTKKGGKVKDNKKEVVCPDVSHPSGSKGPGTKKRVANPPVAPNPKKRPASRASEKPVPSSSSRARKGKGGGDKPKEGLSQNFNETKIANIMEFIEQIDYASLELDDLKHQIYEVLPDLSKCSLNKYWTRQSCGLTMDGSNVATFSVPKNIDCTPSMRTVVSIAVALQIVSR